MNRRDFLKLTGALSITGAIISPQIFASRSEAAVSNKIPDEVLAATECKPMKATFIGVGGCGSNIAEYLYLKNLGNVDYACINTNDVVLQKRTKSKLLIGHSVVRGAGCGGNPELGKLSATADKNQIDAFVSGAAMIFVCAGIGGGTGGGATPVIARIAQDSGHKVIVLAVMPFDFEGKRLLRARSSVDDLRKFIAVIEFRNDKMILNHGGETTLNEAFSAMNDSIGSVCDRLICSFRHNLSFR